MTKPSAYTARIIRTGQILYSGPEHEMDNESHCWFNMEDGSNRGCMMIMDNKQFNRMLKAGEVEILTKNQLNLF